MDEVFQKALCRTSVCCCGCPLKEGTLVLLVLNAIFYVEILVQCLTTNIIETNSRIFVVMLVIFFLLSKVAGIYGMFKKIPAFLIPQMVTQVILMVLYGYIVLSIIFIRPAMIKWTKEEVPTWIEEEVRSLIQDYIGATVNIIVFFLFILFILLIALQYHLYTVVLSYFFKLKQEINYPEQVQMKMITV